MSSHLGHRAGQAASLLLLFVLVGIDACTRRPRKGKLRKIARSDEVRRKRERAERELRARAEEIGRSGPWGPALRTTLMDVCSRGGGRNFLDQNAPKQPAMDCMMRVHLYFVVDGPAGDAVASVKGGELLSWDSPGDNARARISEPCSVRHKAILRTCVSDPAGITLRALRERPGTLVEWTLTTSYHTVPRTR
ncbi:hypothetical protein OG357_09035 [Streptomyces sp. NBC_01255]|uniref:hypothetical protein n=1 Tax=Streptomyces sp. NBC_01255 TaxID=2903798 RepID=UPI002E31F487|nr:hypothetical protein [Streptomyces sp. NBC_01255]